MSLEIIPNAPPVLINREIDLLAARELIEENEVLKNNPRVLALLANDFKLEDNQQVDAGNFLAAMLAYLDTQGNREINIDLLNIEVDRAMVTHSRPTKV